MSVYEQYTPPAGGGAYLKIKDGESVRLRILSEPYVFYSQFKEGDPISTKYAWKVYNWEGESVQVLQQGVNTMRTIQELFTEWGDPVEYDIKISRRGSGLETKYDVTPLRNPVGEITDEIKAEAEKMNIPKLVKGAIPIGDVIKGEEPPAPELDEKSEDDLLDSIPF